MADPTGDTPLLGTHRRAGRYEALLWSAARVPDCALTVTGVLVAEPERTVSDLERAVAAGAAVVAAARALEGPGPATAGLDVLGCATIAALLGTAGAKRLPEVLDLAASLSLLAPIAMPDAGAERVRLIRAGHPAAAGWLACESVRAGLTAMPDAVAATLAAVSGAGVPHAEVALADDTLRLGDLRDVLQ